MKAVHALRVSLGSSRWASVLVCTTCLATAALVAWLPGVAALRAALVIGIGIYAIRTLRHWALRSAPRAILGIELDTDREVRLTERGGRCIEGRVRADSFVGGWVTTLVVRPDNKRISMTVAILPDMLPADDFRRLRLLLRFGNDATRAPDR